MKLANPTLSQVEGIGAGPNQTVANIIDGAQNGVGTHIPYIDGTQPQVFNPIYWVVLGYPSIWDLKGYEYNKAIAKALMERHATSISGIDISYTLNYSDGQIGHDSQVLSTPTNTVRNAVSPSFTFRELKGNLVWNFFKRWLWDINHPDTNASFVAALIEDESMFPEWVVSTYSMTCMAIQFDETGLPGKIIDAVVYAGMFPTETGDMGLEKQLGSSKTMDRTINFKAIMQHNANTRELGIYVAEALNLHRMNYNIATTATGINLNLKTMGLDAEQQRILNEFRLQSSSGIYQFGSNGNGNATSSGQFNDVGGQGYDVNAQINRGDASGSTRGPTEQVGGV